MKKVIYLLLLLILYNCQSNTKTNHTTPNLGKYNQSKIQNKFSDTTLVNIYNLQDQQKTTTLLPYLKHKNPKYREASALAFASIQDSKAIPYLAPLLKDKNEIVRRASALALGQIKDKKALSSLIPQAQQEENISTKTVILEAIGKCADAHALTFLNNLEFDNDSLKWGQANGIFQAALKGEMNEKATQKIFSFLALHKKENEIGKVAKSFVRIMASQYVARFRQQYKINEYQAELVDYLELDNEAEVRANYAKALSEMSHSQIVEDALIYNLEVENSVYVNVEVIRALEKFNYQSCKNLILEKLNDAHPQIVLEASNFFKNKAERTEANELLAIAEKTKFWQVKANLLTAVYRLSEAPEIEELIKNEFDLSNNTYEKGFLLMALAEKKKNFDWLQGKLYASSNSPVVKTYAFEALQKIKGKFPKDEELYDKFGEVCRYAIESQDVALVYLASEALQTPNWHYKSFFKNQNFMRKVLKKLELPLQIEAYQALNQVISFISNQELYPTPKFMDNLPDWKHIQNILPTQKLRFETEKGSFEIQLLVNEAPASVSNFLKLVKKGFFEGKSFHRVINNFVTQGGCPRGDGFGGQNISLRSEFNYQRYKLGSIGLASAGKDTESCQFFISHTSLPHLNGKYTIFAHLTQGKKVLEKLMIGDLIHKIEIM